MTPLRVLWVGGGVLGLWVSGWVSSAESVLLPEKHFASCLQDPVMVQVSEFKNLQGTQLVAMSGSASFPKLQLQTVLAPIQGVRGGASTYSTTDAWGPYWSFRVQLALPFFFFGAEALINDAVAAFRQWIEGSREARKRLLLQTLTEGYIQRGFFYQVRRDLRKFLRHLELQASTTGIISAKESAHAKIKQLDLEMEQFEKSLLDFLSYLCPSHRDQFVDPNLFWGEPFAAWVHDMGVAIEQKWPEMDRFMEQSEEIRDHQAQLKMVEGEHAVISRPKLFLAGLVDGAVSPTREAVENPYVYDPYNQTTVGVGVGLRWDFDLFPVRQKQLQATVLKEKIFMTMQQEKKRYFDLTALKGGLPKRQAEVERSKKRLDQAMSELKWQAKEDGLKTLSSDAFDHFQSFYKTTHESALQYYRDIVQLYFAAAP